MIHIKEYKEIRVNIHQCLYRNSIINYKKTPQKEQYISKFQFIKLYFFEIIRDIKHTVVEYYNFNQFTYHIYS